MELMIKQRVFSWTDSYDVYDENGVPRYFVKAEFLVAETSKAVLALREMDIDTDGEIIISRKFSENGKNALKINGNTVSICPFNDTISFDGSNGLNITSKSFNLQSLSV